MAEQATNNCADCGKEIGENAVRCKTCWGAVLARQSLENTAEADREILAMVEAEKLNGGRLAARLGISRVRGVAKIRLARQREERRVQAGIR